MAACVQCLQRVTSMFFAMPPAAGHPVVSAYSQSDGHTCVMVAVEGRLAAAVSLFDPIKSEARGVVTALHTAGLQCHLLTGDNRCDRRLLGHRSCG
jgi:cation transport ATPase